MSKKQSLLDTLEAHLQETRVKDAEVLLQDIKDLFKKVYGARIKSYQHWIDNI